MKAGNIDICTLNCVTGGTQSKFYNMGSWATAMFIATKSSPHEPA
jgi:hypothetical protein